MDAVRLGARSAYPGLLALGALDAAGYSIIAPVLPAISVSTGAGPAVIGAIVAAFRSGSSSVSRSRAALSRHTERGRSSSLAFLALGGGGFAAGGALPSYFACRFLMGLGSGGLWIIVTLDTLGRWPGQEYLRLGAPSRTDRKGRISLGLASLNRRVTRRRLEQRSSERGRSPQIISS